MKHSNLKQHFYLDFILRNVSARHIHINNVCFISVFSRAMNSYFHKLKTPTAEYFFLQKFRGDPDFFTSLYALSSVSKLIIINMTLLKYFII